MEADSAGIVLLAGDCPHRPKPNRARQFGMLRAKSWGQPGARRVVGQFSLMRTNQQNEAGTGSTLLHFGSDNIVGITCWGRSVGGLVL